MAFLQAEWRKLAIANYSVDPQLLQKYLPQGTQLDLWNDTCYVSLVGFMFLNTKLLGIKIPFHINFEEVNLRFYVKYNDNGNWKRGVVFIKEIVPKPALSWVANTIYKEHYQTLPMKHLWLNNADTLSVHYQWKRKGQWQSLNVVAGNVAEEIPQGSETEFITEHYWGYSGKPTGPTNEYEVTHPRWRAYPVKDYAINVDFALVYGGEFAILNQQKPQSVMLAEGSAITVENKRQLIL